MPSLKSHRNQVNKYKVNLSIKTAIKSSITRLRNSVTANASSEETDKLLRDASKVLDY